MAAEEECAEEADEVDEVAQRAAPICGVDWQDAYAAFHADVVAGPSSSARLLVFDASGNGGLADRLTGLMTALLLAILSDRAIALDWSGREVALRMPRLSESGNTRLLKAARAAQSSDTRRVTWLNANRTALQQEVIHGMGGVESSSGIDALWPERVVYLRSNRGFTQQLLNAPGLASLVAARRLTPASAQFGCLFNFLLRPTDAALRPVRSLMSAMRDPVDASDGRYVTVGVHVRSGDSTWSAEGADAATDAEAMRTRGASLYASHKFIYEYADRLSQALASNMSARIGSHVSARLLLLGDSSALRAHVATLHSPEKLLVPTGALGHVARQADALSNAVGEHWLYGHATAFVYSSHSGFPRTAAARAVRDDAIHTCYHYVGPTLNPQPTARKCTGPYSIAQLGERHAAGL